MFNSSNTKLGTFISANKEVYSENLRYSFIFENCTIPEEYAYVKLSTSSTDSESKRDYQPFRVVPLRDKNNQNKETNRIESPDCYFSWVSNGVLSGGINRIANVITSRNINNEVQTDITTNKEEDANSLSTTQAIKDFVNEQIITKSLTEIIEGDFIEVDYGNVVSVSTSKKISDNSKTVPTTKAVYDELNPHITNDTIHLTEELHETIDELVVADEYNDFVFDLSNIFFKYINKDWVEKIVILSIDTDSASPYKEYGIVVPGDIDIPYHEKFYPDSDSIYLELNNLQISDTPPTPTINAVGFDLSDVAKSAISEKIIQLSRIFWSKTKNGTITETIQNDFNVEVNKLKKSVPLKARWIADAKNGICKAPLSFQGSTHRRNEILRTFFYYLD